MLCASTPPRPPNSRSQAGVIEVCKVLAVMEHGVPGARRLVKAPEPEHARVRKLPANLEALDFLVVRRQLGFGEHAQPTTGVGIKNVGGEWLIVVIGRRRVHRIVVDDAPLRKNSQSEPPSCSCAALGRRGLAPVAARRPPAILRACPLGASSHPASPRHPAYAPSPVPRGDAVGTLTRSTAGAPCMGHSSGAIVSLRPSRASLKGIWQERRDSGRTLVSSRRIPSRRPASPGACRSRLNRSIRDRSRTSTCRRRSPPRRSRARAAFP